jgi:DNA (cytosine-5)-methyltransferase 1
MTIATTRRIRRCRHRGLTGRPTITDLFCGAGGSISGMEEAGFEIVLGANHDPVSIETVSTNHPDAEFLCADINNLDMRKLPSTDGLWASVICTEESPAGGRKKRRGQQVMEFEELGHIRNETFERTRACALDVLRATEVHQYDFVIVENVVEFGRDWELFDWWIDGMGILGYSCQIANLNAAHVYSDENEPAPQWRDRIFIVFTYEGVPQPNLANRPPAWCPKCEDVFESEQWFKRPSARPLGKFRQQYLYRHGYCSTIVEPYVLPASAAVDLSDLGTRIGDRKKPLSPNTMARVQWGIDFLAWPVIAQVAGNTYERPGYHRVWGGTTDPLSARQGTGTDAIAGPMLSNHGHSSSDPADGRQFMATDAPLPTRTGKISEGVASFPIGIAEHKEFPLDDEPRATVVAQGRGHQRLVTVPFITMARRNGTGTNIAKDALATMAGARHHYLTSPPGSFYVKNFGGPKNANPKHLAKSLDGNPLGSITTADHHALVIPYRKGAHPHLAADGPLGTQTTKTSEGLLRPQIDIMDCYYRTLRSHEHLAAQRFARDYVVIGNEGQRTLQAGNAVAVNCARFIGERLMAVLA